MRDGPASEVLPQAAARAEYSTDINFIRVASTCFLPQGIWFAVIQDTNNSERGTKSSTCLNMLSTRVHRLSTDMKDDADVGIHRPTSLVGLGVVTYNPQKVGRDCFL